nr:30S ribosomal protein S3 [Chitinophagales bacterium]
RSEEIKQGRVPLHTFRADIDYALAEAQTVYGKIGIKVWICKGEIYGKRDLSPNVGQKTNEMQRPKSGTGGGGDRDRERGGGRRSGGGGGRGKDRERPEKS